MSTHRARKRFGQHFLTDPGVIEHIVRAIDPQASDNLVEIGPGKGAITASLAALCHHLQVVEIDRDLVALLQRQLTDAQVTVTANAITGAEETSGRAVQNTVTIHQVDALTVDFSLFAAAGGRVRIVGNLPYNISTPLIFHLLRFYDHIQDMYFMLQNEVVERLVAQPGDKHYGRLSVMVQYYCRADKLFEVAPHCFVPRPKVNSAIVRLVPHRPLPYIADDPDQLSQLVNFAFQQRRKTLHNALKNNFLKKDLLKKSASKSFIDIKQPNVNPDNTQPLPVDTRLRPENFSVSDYVALSNFLVRNG